MKKILCLLMALIILIVCFAGCSDNGTDDTSSKALPVSDVSETASQSKEEFVKPEKYASVVLVTINPKFRLYLDADNVVLAVEPVNDDAKTINKKVEFKNQKVDAVVNNLITVANDSGFIKEDAVIDFKVSEIVDEKVVATTILNEVKTAATKKADELKIEVEVKTEIATSNTENTETSSTEEAPTSSKQTAPSSSEVKPVVSENKTCKHTKVTKKPANTGKNIIDSSKLDMLNHNKICNDCKAVIGTEKHTVKSGKCTVCGQSNFATATLSVDDAGISGGPSGHCGAEVSSDGTPDFDYMMQEAYFAIGFETLEKHLNTTSETWMYEIPEAVFLKALKTKFVMTDSLFANLKAQKKYDFFWCNHSYSNGIFYIPYVAAGDVSEFTHNLKGYKDNKNGSITVYYDYLEGGPDVEEKERKHLFYYAIEYSYSGASNLEIVKIVEEYYEHYDFKGWKPVVNSLRIKSIKKVASIPSVTTVK